MALGGYHAALAARLVTATSGGVQVSGSRPTGLSLDPRVVRARSEIYTLLATWARAVATERGVGLPHDSCPAIATFLVWHLDWCCARPWVDDLHAGVVAIAGQARALLYPTSRHRRPVGRCVEVTTCDVATGVELRCEGTLAAFVGPADDLLPPTLVCGTCGTEIPATGWYAFARRYKAMEVA